jgi:hypothetical protein
MSRTKEEKGRTLQQGSIRDAKDHAIPSGAGKQPNQYSMHSERGTGKKCNTAVTRRQHASRDWMNSSSVLHCPPTDWFT